MKAWILICAHHTACRETARVLLAPERPWQAAVLVGPSVLIDHCRAELLAAGTPAEAISTDQFD